MLLWRKRFASPYEAWMPSTMEPCTWRSAKTRSRRSTSEEMTPRLVVKPVEKLAAASFFRKVASLWSSSSCSARVPFASREPQVEAPQRRAAWAAASFTRGSCASPR